jgi:hypothetical protein
MELSGFDNCPSPSPSEPHFIINSPLSVNTWTFARSLSVTNNFPSASLAGT